MEGGKRERWRERKEKEEGRREGRKGEGGDYRKILTME